MRRSALFLLLLVPAALRAQEPVWPTDWDTAFALAKTQHKLVFVDYVANSCTPCSDIERIVLPSVEVQKHIRDFVLLRVDVDRSKVPAIRRFTPPSYVVFDPDERERFRIGGEHILIIDDWRDHGGQPADDYVFWGPLEKIRLAAPAFVNVAELLDAKRDLDASFLLGNTYSRLKMTAHARAAYAAARAAAEGHGDAAAAQLAEAQSAFTYVREGNAARAIELLNAIASKPLERHSEPLVWLSLGEAYESANQKQRAIDAYTHAKNAAAPESRAAADAAKALARLQ